MKLTEKEKVIYKEVMIHFCLALNSSPKGVTEAMNKGPCFLGSQRHFENTTKAIIKALRDLK